MRALGSSLSNLSLKHRLSLLTASLLLGIILPTTAPAYCGVKQSALAVGREQLLNLTQPLVNLPQQSTTNLLSPISATATNEPAVIVFLQSPSPVLQQFGSAQIPNVQVHLLSANKSLALSPPEDSSAAAVAVLTSEFEDCATDPFKVRGSTGMVKYIAAYRAVAAAKDNKRNCHKS